jgi:uncharacterized protein (DUF2141 family)
VHNFLSTLAGLLIISNCVFSQFTLKIDITEIRNNSGKIMLQVFDEKEKVLFQEMSDIKEKCCSFTFKNLRSGKYAVRFYHDENLDQVMETNMVGRPTEGYGFSNNVTNRFSMPPFEKWLFSLNENKTIVLKTVY